MAQFDTQYYIGDDQYSDGSVEERILQIVQEGKSLEESGDRSFSVLYHLSNVRENILSWYDFEKNASVLEIGAGPGAITSLLCRRCGHVTSVELSRLRAKINFERNKRFDNLTIMVGNLNDMHFDRPFDYVILNGVFEYAGSFTEGTDPYGTFLKHCAGYLKEDGLLLIAIENRLGLKYFSGAPEDHTENYMEGLKQYPENSSVRTFSRAEWEQLCECCGLSYRRYFYPYPDYKFSNEIFTKETLRADAFGKNAWNFDEKRLELFNEQEMAQSLVQEGVMESFMNSFLIEAGSEKARKAHVRDEVLYAKISADRSPAFRIQTVIRRRKDGSKYVVKSPLCEEAKLHLLRMHEWEEAQDGKVSSGKTAMPLLKGDLQEDGSIVYPFLETKSLAQCLKADASSIREAFRLLLDRILDNAQDGCEYTEEFTKLFGPARPDTDLCMVSPANLDLILDNIFRDGDHEKVIDGEWITKTPVPALFLLWRAVNELYSSRKEMERTLPVGQLLEEFGINASLRQVFWTWASHFEKEYVKANQLGLYAVPARKADLKDLQWSGENVRLTATLYTDRGNGFREEEALHRDVVLEKGAYDVTFDLEKPEEIRALRFDPLEGTACICDLSAEQGKLKAMNASAIHKNGEVFLTMDPAYRLSFDQIPAKIHLFGKVKTKDIYWALSKSQELLRQSRLGVLGRAARRAARQFRTS